MRARVLKPFAYSINGITPLYLDAGDELDFRDDLAPGLLAERFIAKIEFPPEGDPPGAETAPLIRLEPEDEAAVKAALRQLGDDGQKDLATPEKPKGKRR